MRYQVRFANGEWRVFDTHEYTTVRLARSQRDAAGFTYRMNNGK